MLANVLKIVGASILAIAIIWALVLGWWQANDYQPSSFELLLYLGALPLALIGGFLLLKGFIDHIKNPPAPSEPQNPETIDNDPLASAAAKTAAAERGYSIALIGASVATASGMSSSEILDAVAAGKRPEPDAELLDEAGFPVFSARVERLDADVLGEWLAAHQDTLPKHFLDGEPVRALALLDMLLPAALDDARNLMDKNKPETRLRIQWLVPSSWERDHYPALLAWLRDSYLAEFDKTRFEASVRPVGTEVDVLKEIDELILAAKREQLEHDIHLIVGANSHIGESTVQTWSDQNRLFTANRQSGQIPGESAICLLFTGTPEDGVITPDESVRVSRISSARRDKSADAGGRVGSALLEQLIGGVLTIRGIDAADVKKIVSDGDHRDTRVTELMTAVGQQFKELDPMADCHSIGIACGTTSPLGGLLALACSRDKVLAEGGSVVCISNQDAIARAVLVVEPFSPSPGSENAGVQNS